MKKILISTKLKTTNIGNQALSDELSKLAEDMKSKENYYKILGRPFGLDKYTIHDLDRSNLLKDFEKTANEIFVSTKSLPNEAYNFSVNTIYTKTDLLNVDGSIVKTEKLRRLARKLRKFILRFKNYAPAYKERLTLYKDFEYYLYSAAGEVSEQDYFYRQLLDLRVAQLMGLKVCAINQSIELPIGLYNEILIYVYSKMHSIIVRGDISKQFLLQAGVEPSKISVAPDTAFLCKAKGFSKRQVIKKIAVNFTPKTYIEDHVNPFLQRLINDGYELTFITNDPFSDKAVGSKLETDLGIPVCLQSLDYANYVEFICDFDLVISSRLHTNELALIGGVPILPIEGNMHKTTEVLAYVNYPSKVVSSISESYGSDLTNSFNDIKTNYSEKQDWFDLALNETKVKSRENLTKIK